MSLILVTTRVSGLPDNVDGIILCSFVWTQYERVTDRNAVVNTLHNRAACCRKSGLVKAMVIHIPGIQSEIEMWLFLCENDKSTDISCVHSLPHVGSQTQCQW